MNREQQRAARFPLASLWFAALWLAGVAAVALIGLAIRAVLS